MSCCFLCCSVSQINIDTNKTQYKKKLRTNKMFALEQRRGKLNKIKEIFGEKKNYIFKDKTQ